MQEKTKKYLGLALIIISLIYLVFILIDSFGASPTQYCFTSTPSGIQQKQLIQQVSLNPFNCDATQKYFYLVNYLPNPIFLIILILAIIGGILLLAGKNGK